MKKFIAMMLVLAMLSMAMVACSEPSDDGEGTDTSSDSVADTAADTAGDTAADTEADTAADTAADTEAETEAETEEPAGDEPNMFPYEGDVIPGSIDYDWGAPDATSVYFSIDADHVIHDGKGTWSNSTACIAPMVFDNDFTTFYDCDEKCETANTDEVLVGIPGTWDGDTTLTGYVGAWIEEGVVLTQIRFFPRSGDATINARMPGGTFQASVDGENWVDLHTITELASGCGDYEFVDIDDDTVYYYVRYLSRDLAKFNEYVNADSTDYYAYCNIAEMEIWGTPAN